MASRSSDGLFDPKIDIVFKSIFGKEKDLFCSFTNSVIQPTKEKEIVDIEFINTEIPKENLEEKLSRLDVLAKLKDGSMINIEVQIKNADPFFERVLYYWSKIFISQLKSGDYYDKLKKVICINIVDFIMFEDNQDFHNEFEIVNKKTKKKASDVLEIHFLETKKFKDSHKTMLDKWMMFLKDPMVASRLEKKDSLIAKARDCLVVLSHNEHAKSLYEARLDRIRLDYGSLKLAKKQGVLEVALKMKSLGISRETIANATGLSIEEIKKI